MEVNLGDIKIELTKSVYAEYKTKKSTDHISRRTMNCIFSKGFKNGSGSRESKNFYFYLEEGNGELPGRGLIFKAGMEWAPKELKEYMEFLKEMYSELVEQQGEFITAEEFLGYLVYKRRSEIIDNI
jgi:hypothetical protein